MARELNDSPARVALEIALRPFGQIVFSRDLSASALVLAAVATVPRVALAAVAAVLIATALSLLFGLGSAALREGGPTCTAVLTTLALLVFDPGAGSIAALVVLGAVLSVFYYASFEAVFAPVTLPTHSFPFVAATWTVHLAARVLPAVERSADLFAPLPWIPPSWLEPSWIDVPASIVFSHGAAAGALVLLAIATHSRISLLLAAIGWGSSILVRAWLRADMPWSLVDVTAGFNAILTAVALGGVWFVPQPSSMLLSAAASAVAGVVTYALFPFVGIASLPVISLPFVVTTHLMLTAARRRVQDRLPRSTVPDVRPEEALARHLMWVRRFGDAAWLPFRLPFRGEWVVSQGHNGTHTHQGLWRHGLDFEGRSASGRPFERDGRELRDYACYGLPVLAAGAGTVVQVIDGIPDNKPGELNIKDNWGNAVVLAHGAGLYSVYAHLQMRSIRVKQGEVIPTGGELGRCGSSGRSPTPHLHFQVQRTATLGSPTLPADFGDVVRRTDSDLALLNRVIPAEGDLVRPVLRDEAMARALTLTPGSVFDLVEEGTSRTERVEVKIDLLGRRSLESDKARLFLDPYDAALVFVDFRGNPRSLLSYLLVGLARLPFDQASSLTWRDSLPRRLLLPSSIRAAADLLAVVVPEFGSIEIEYRLERTEGKLRVLGKAKTWTTEATLSLGDGPHRIELTHGERKRVMEMRPVREQQGAAS